jgi:hypothetical protein
MKEQFQAKDIREALEINQRRLQYLIEKMRIDPDIEEAGGSGHAHLHSFKNFLLIAIAHYLNSIGMGPSTVKSAISFLLEETPDDLRNDFFNPKDNKRFVLFTLFGGGESYFALIDTRRVEWALSGMDFMLGSPLSKKFWMSIVGAKFDEDAQLRLNLFSIKKRIVEYAKR